MAGELLEQIKIVAEARAKAIALKTERDERLDVWNKTNQDLLEDLTQAGANMVAEETKLRELTLRAYQETGNKSPAPGVGIREVTKFEYEQQEAFNWGLDHGLALKLDTPAFEKIAKVSPPEFVEIHTEAQATIATDLNKVLQEG